MQLKVVAVGIGEEGELHGVRLKFNGRKRVLGEGSELGGHFVEGVALFGGWVGCLIENQNSCSSNMSRHKIKPLRSSE